jgi:creatinine amidohydrolase
VEGKSDREVRIQYMLPGQLLEEREKLPLIFLPLAPLEWHGPHLAVGIDPLNAENTAIALAQKIGGVTLPTLFMGTERERPPEMLKSLGFQEDDYIVGMDFPTAKGIYNSFYFPEEIFALTVRAHIEQCLGHSYKYVFIVNGHGAVNHNQVLKRLAIEFNNRLNDAKVGFSISFPRADLARGLASHAGKDETSLMMYYNRASVDLTRLPPLGGKLRYQDYSVVDDGGFTGCPGPGFTVCDECDPRTATVEFGERLFEKIVKDLTEQVNDAFDFK